MAYLGQASGEWTESSSALRLLHIGIRNTQGVLTQDAFEQTNPPISSTGVTTAPGLDTLQVGVLSGSVAFTRPDVGNAYLGGPVEGLAASPEALLQRPLGCFINSSRQGAYENTPGLASGKGPYVSAQGTYANKLYETAVIGGGGSIAGYVDGDAITYFPGVALIASRNGFLMPAETVDGAGTGLVSLDVDGFGHESTMLSADGSGTTLAILKSAPDSQGNELIYDQRI